MIALPDAALATIEAALDDYRLTVPPDQQTPHGATTRIGEYLASSGWQLTPDMTDTTTGGTP